MSRLSELITEITTDDFTPDETYLLAEDSSEESKKIKASTILSEVNESISDEIEARQSADDAEASARSAADTSLDEAKQPKTLESALTIDGTSATTVELALSALNTKKAAKSEAVGGFMLSMDSSTYVVSLQAKDVDGNNIGSAQTIDLPLESVVVSGSYDSESKEVELTLKDGSTIAFSVADLISGLQSEITGAASSITDDDLTAHKVLVSDVNGKVSASSVTTTELGNLSGTTGSVQTQIDGINDNIGDLSDLDTISKTDIVSAINEAAAASGGEMLSVTWSALKTARDNGELTPGQLYRITDYVTTTVQANTQSAGHQFDIIVRADAADVINEDAWAALHDGDTYFADARLESWRLRYCIDNDTSRFVWADETDGKGVIYRLIDQNGNDLPYDFKNIKFLRYKVTARTDTTKPSDPVNRYYSNETTLTGYTVDTSDYKYFFTFAASEYGQNADIDCSLIGYNRDGDDEEWWAQHVNRNKMGPFLTYASSVYLQSLNNNVFYCGFYSEEDYSTASNTIGNNFYSNTIGNNFYSNTIGSYFYNNTIGSDFSSNTIGSYFYSNTIGSDFYRNTIGSYYRRNKFGAGCRYITSSISGSASNYVQKYEFLEGTGNIGGTTVISVTLTAGNWASYRVKNSSSAALTVEAV